MRIQAEEKMWFLLQDKKSVGPYSFREIVGFLQERRLYEFDYVWGPNFPNWKRLCDTEEFNSERIARVYENKIEREAFLQRQSPRYACSLTGFITDHLEVWPTKITSLSKGGLNLEVQSPILVPGRELLLHLKRQNDFSGENVPILLTNKRFVKDRITYNTKVTHTAKFMSPLTFPIEKILATK